jgi:hypothetical protein
MDVGRASSGDARQPLRLLMRLAIARERVCLQNDSLAGAVGTNRVSAFGNRSQVAAIFL